MSGVRQLYWLAAASAIGLAFAAMPYLSAEETACAGCKPGPAAPADASTAGAVSLLLADAQGRRSAEAQTVNRASAQEAVPSGALEIDEQHASWRRWPSLTDF